MSGLKGLKTVVGRVQEEHMQNRVKKIGIRELIFYLELIVICFSSVLSNSRFNISVDSLLNIQIYSVLLLTTILMFFSKYRVKQFVLMIIAVLVSSFIYYYSGTTYILLMVLVWISAQNINKKNAVMVIRNVLIIAVFFVVLSSLVGIIDFGVLYKNGHRRYTFGFNHSNVLAYYFLQIFMIDILLRYKQYKRGYYILGVAIAIAVMLFTYSFASTICIFILYAAVLLSILYKDNPKIISVLRKLAMVSFPLCSALSMFFMTNYERSAHLTLNILTTGRIALMNQYYRVFGINIFGHNIAHTGGLIVADQQILDCSYAALILQCGLVAFVSINILYFILAKNYKGNSPVFYVCIIVTAIIALFERTLFGVTTNFTLLFLTFIISKKELIALSGEIK
jgi:hypothetical protein